MRTAAPTDTQVPRKKRWKLRIILLLVVLPLLLFAGYTWLTLNFSYAVGERSGYIQKISKRGWICKTWEGELAMTTVPGVAPVIFPFSVRSDAVAHQVSEYAGRRVSLSYQQHKGIPTTCFGETEYFVTAVRIVGQ
jgi:hypothetical protein